MKLAVSLFLCITFTFGQQVLPNGSKDFLLMKNIGKLCSRFCIERPKPRCESAPAIYAPLDEIKGTISPGVGVDVKLSGDPTLVNGHMGKAVHTPNTGTYDDNYMNLGFFANECINDIDKCEDGYTVSFWYKKDPGNHQFPVLGSASDWQIWDEDSYIEHGKNAPYFSWFKKDGRRYIAGGSKAVTNGEWHHIALVAKNRNDVKFYVDGEMIADRFEKKYNTRITYKNVEFGCFNRQNCISAAFDEIKIWEEAKSDAEIKEIFLTKKRR